jgi:hypothetical protein
VLQALVCGVWPSNCPLKRDNIFAAWFKNYALNKSGQPPQRIGLFFPVFMAIVDPLDAADDVAHDALGDFRPYSRASHQ